MYGVLGVDSVVVPPMSDRIELPRREGAGRQFVRDVLNSIQDLRAPVEEVAIGAVVADGSTLCSVRRWISHPWVEHPLAWSRIVTCPAREQR